MTGRAGGLGPVVFDAYGTLFDPRALALPLEQAFPGRGADLAARWRTTQLRHTWLRSLMGDWADFDAITRDALAQEVDAAGLSTGDGLADALLDAYRTLPAYADVPAALAALEPDRPRAILTNGRRATVEATVRAAGLEELLPIVLSVERVQVYKPSPAVYALATDHFGVPAAAITFVSGNAWDCAGAGAFGFRVVRVRRSTEAPERLARPPFATVDDLGGLAEVLAS